MKSLMNLVSDMFKLKFGILFLLLPAFAFAQDTPEFDRLKTAFEEDRVFEAAFVHEYNDTFTGEQQVTEGTIWVGKDQYKIHSGNNTMVVDGEVSRVYDASKNRVIVSDYVEEDDDFAPSRMLQGVDDSYAVEETSERVETLILLVSDDPFSIFLQVLIVLNSEGLPLRIEAIDQVENELITFFQSGRFVQETSETFRFQSPDDAEYIDLRHGS
jgi:outer membrane lipoprotein-sorting protein